MTARRSSKPFSQRPDYHARMPNVSFTEADNVHQGTAESVRSAYGHPDKHYEVYEGYVGADEAPNPRLAEESDADEHRQQYHSWGSIEECPDLDEEGNCAYQAAEYDWDDFQHRRGPFPAPTLYVPLRGSPSWSDGNHRVDFWSRNRNSYTHYPAWILRERPAPRKTRKTELNDTTRLLALARLLQKATLDPTLGYTFQHHLGDEMPLGHGEYPYEGSYKRGKRHFWRGLGITAHDAQGNEVGRADFFVRPEDLFPGNVEVDKGHQRRGIASAMYAHAEKLIGRRVVPSDDQTDDARRLWAANRRRPQFGKPRMTKAESLQKMAIESIPVGIEPLQKLHNAALLLLKLHKADDLDYDHEESNTRGMEGGTFHAYRNGRPVAHVTWFPDDDSEDEESGEKTAHVNGLWAEPGARTSDGLRTLDVFANWLRENHPQFTHVTHHPISQAGYMTMRQVFGEPSMVEEDGAGHYHTPKDRLEAIKILPRIARVDDNLFGGHPQLEADNTCPDCKGARRDPSAQESSDDEDMHQECERCHGEGTVEYPRFFVKHPLYKRVHPGQ